MYFMVCQQWSADVPARHARPPNPRAYAPAPRFIVVKDSRIQSGNGTARPISTYVILYTLHNTNSPQSWMASPHPTTCSNKQIIRTLILSKIAAPLWFQLLLSPVRTCFRAGACVVIMFKANLIVALDYNLSALCKLRMFWERGSKQNYGE